MNLIDTSTNSPHYFYWKHIGITNENLNFDVRGCDNEDDDDNKDSQVI